METVANLFLFIENGVIKSLGVVAHSVELGDDGQISQFLKERVIADSSIATRHPLPIDSIHSWLGVDAKSGLEYKYFAYLHRTGKALWLFEKPLQAINAPSNPFVCFTPIVENKPEFTSSTHANPLANPTIQSEEFGGIIKMDWLAANTTDDGLNIHDLLADDFTEAIKLLYQHKHYVAAMKLVVSFIDTLAYLEYGDVASNFETWLSTFANLAPVGIAPNELWELRNSLLHMTNPISRKVLSGKVTRLYFYTGTGSRTVLIDSESGTKMFSFEALYDSLILALEIWGKSFNGNLPKQLIFIERYDTIMSERRLGTVAQRAKPQQV